MVASHTDGCRIDSRWGCTDLYYTRRRSGGTAHEGGGCYQLIGSTVSDSIVSSWLRSTAIISSPLGCYSGLLQVVDNWPHILLYSIFSTGRLLAIEDFTFNLSFISRPFTFILSASAPYHSVHRIIPSYRDFITFVPNPLLLRTLLSPPHALCPSFILCAHNVQTPFTSSIRYHFRARY